VSEAEPPRCCFVMSVPEQLRRTGRGKSGFERHYVKQQCSRRAGESGYCWQHDPATIETRRIRIINQMWNNRRRSLGLPPLSEEQSP
jgi:hypothetical protein